jgi:predicted nucleic acid-binding protein
LLIIDTDIAIGIIHGKIDLGQFRDRIVKDGQIAITSLSMYELYYGLYLVEFRKKGKARKEDIDRERLAIEKIKATFIRLPFDDVAAEKGAMIYHDLARRGQEIDEYDCMIAGTVLSQKGGALLTNNTSHFARMDGFPLVPFDSNANNDA